MIPTTHRREITIGSRTLSIETGKLAKQADGAVIVRSGDTMVIVTACHAANPRVGIDFLPLTVDYQEKTYAAGRIPGGFFRRALGCERRTLSASLEADRTRRRRAKCVAVRIRDGHDRIVERRLNVRDPPGYITTNLSLLCLRHGSLPFKPTS